MRPFKFKAIWLEDGTCREVVEKFWEKSETQAQKLVVERIEEHAKALQEWNKNPFGKIGVQKRKIEEEIKECQFRKGDQEAESRQAILEQQLMLLHEREETMWKQRSKALWLMSGDINTKFFHGKASTRRRTNTISKLRDREGNISTKMKEFGQIMENYFKELFTTTNSDLESFPEECINKKITEEQKLYLQRPYASEEVREALK